MTIAIFGLFCYFVGVALGYALGRRSLGKRGADSK